MTSPSHDVTLNMTSPSYDVTFENDVDVLLSLQVSRVDERVIERVPGAEPQRPLTARVQQLGHDEETVTTLLPVVKLREDLREGEEHSPV